MLALLGVWMRLCQVESPCRKGCGWYVNPYPPKCWRSWNFFIPIMCVTHFGAPLNFLKFKLIWSIRNEDMGMCAIAHNGSTRDKTGRFYEVIIYILHLFSFIPVIQFEVLRILVLWMEMDTDEFTVVSVPIGVKKLDIFAREGQILPGGVVFYFFPWNMWNIETLPNEDLLLSC